MIEFALGVIGGVVITCIITSAGRCSLLEEIEELNKRIKELNTK